MKEINKSLKENQEKAIKLVKETVQDLKTEIVAVKETLTKRIWKWKIWVNNKALQM